MPKVQLPVRIEKEDLEKLRDFAKSEGLILSLYVDMIVKDHIEQKNKIDVCPKCNYKLHPSGQCVNKDCDKLKEITNAKY